MEQESTSIVVVVDENSRNSRNSGSSTALDCVICLSTANEAFVITHVQCRQSFHLHCILQWMQVSRTCPVCRQRVGPDNDLNQLSVVRQQEQQTDVCVYVSAIIIVMVVVLLISIHYMS
jgi:hypothetical protein